VGAVRNEILTPPLPFVLDEELSHGQFRHGEERSWGGYGGGRYEEEEARSRGGRAQ
jgi:hypothetical protein